MNQEHVSGLLEFKRSHLFVALNPMGVITFFQGLSANATERRKTIISNRAIVGFLTLA